MQTKSSKILHVEDVAADREIAGVVFERLRGEDYLGEA